MDALLNADTRRGGNNPSSAGLTSSTSPEVQGQETKNSQTGVSSNCVPKGKKQWFVLRATYGRTEKALGYFQAKNVETYLPMHYVVKIVNGNRKLIKEPLLPNIIFAYMTREKTYEFVKKPALTASWIKYYTDKTMPVEPETGKNPPVIIPDNEMTNFIKLTSVNSEHIMVLPPKRCHFKKDDLVRIIEGPFTGVVGRVGRAAGQQRVFVVLEGLCNVATAYIPNDFIQSIDTFTR